jgi:hypothetical protein
MTNKKGNLSFTVDYLQEMSLITIAKAIEQEYGRCTLYDLMGDAIDRFVSDVLKMGIRNYMRGK